MTKLHEMDREIIKPKLPLYVKLSAVMASLLIIFFMTKTLFQTRNSILAIDKSNLTIADVISGKFDDFIPIRASVAPARTLFLDTLEGGRVDAVFVENGQYVEKGTIISNLSNTEFQLDIISREAQIIEQQNALRTAVITFEQNKFRQDRDLAEINYELIRLKRVIERNTSLVAEGAANRATLEELMDEQKYYRELKKIVSSSQESDRLLQQQQIQQLEASTAQLKKNLSFARKSLENLTVKAPITGIITAFDIDVGQSLKPGYRLGQIDDPSEYKLEARIDEFYLSRLYIGLKGVTTLNNIEYDLEVTKIYPEVRDSHFIVDLKFISVQPSGIKRGQNIQGKLFLGNSNQTLLIPNSSFMEDTGGLWIFVLNEDGLTSAKRPIRIGRRNPEFIEILDGLDAGDQVIVSSYRNFVDIDRLKIIK